MRRLVALLIAASVLVTGCIQLPVFSFGTEEKEKVKAEKIKPQKEKEPDETQDDQGMPDPTAKPKQKAPKKGK